MPRPKLDRDAVKHIAKLASLSLSDDEADRFAGDLERIVAYVEELDAVDTTGVVPTAHSGEGSISGRVGLDRSALRADEPKEGLTHDAALASAPRAENDGFAVPGFVES
jgi:aspartyl-tRNA(Asn)/glutamyl-tRNA(Gln) amidotransferase subunit C